MIVSDLFTERKKSSADSSDSNGNKSWSDPEFERELLYAKVRYPNLDPETALLKMYQQAFDQTEKNEQLQNSAIADLNAQVEQLKDKVDSLQNNKTVPQTQPQVEPVAAPTAPTTTQQTESRQEKIRIARMILESARDDINEALPWSTKYSLLPSVAKSALRDIEDTHKAHVSKNRAIAQIKKLAGQPAPAYASKPYYTTTSYSAGNAPVPIGPTLKKLVPVTPAVQSNASTSTSPKASSEPKTPSSDDWKSLNPWRQKIYNVPQQAEKPADAAPSTTVKPDDTKTATPEPAPQAQTDIGSQVFANIARASTSPTKSSTGGTIRKTPTGVIHTAKSSTAKPTTAPKIKKEKPQASVKKAPPSPRGPVSKGKKSKPAALRIGGQKIPPSSPLYSKIMKPGLKESLDWSVDFDPSATILSNIDSQSR